MIRLTHARQQKGAVLAICLIMLLILTVIGVASMSNSTLQERMAGGARDYNMAFQAAEAALRVGEDYVRDQVAAAADPAELFMAPEDCPAITTADWAPPTNVTSGSRPECSVSNYYAESASTGAGGVAFICETDGSIAETNAFNCLSKTYLYNVEATGYGSTDTGVTVRSTVAIAIRGQN
ncbi:pilus assembly PilX family protein [Pseudomonas sp. UBA2684]|uniref:pilus assembly PilX family protein n=1 Tax=Pseudomonas sp. UBA2684 TaxID=1947311 RepID=UPI0025DA0276|nr:PilX N-terminal domain-containing pilus assembly protein [Pseudomonas sp. UBA2684]|tara:strand:- start:19416 stop:19955 length:540 start_codon:yes stop_codon:yes gene_type:complete